MDSKINIQLLRKVADSIVSRLEEESDSNLAQADLDRIRRFVDSGQVGAETLRQALLAIVNSDALESSFKESFRAELGRLEGANTTLSQPTTDEKAPYRTADLLLPASMPVTELARRGWTMVHERESKDFLAQIGPIDGVYRVRAKTTQCLWRSLPWFDTVAIIRVCDPGWEDPDLVIYYLAWNGSLFRLNGSSPPIHEVNAKASIKIDSDNVLDYMRFFMFFVRGDDGPFYVAERVDDPLLPMASDDKMKAKIKRAIRPARLERINKDGHYIVKASVIYGNRIFLAVMAVQPSGMIDMTNDRPSPFSLEHGVRAPLA
tara:strand:+ start:29634 stop:30587 length:954 start_codon:yes stop_codon:yes gene_type:complete